MIEGIHTTRGFWPDYPDKDPSAWYIELRWVEREGTIRCVGMTLTSVTGDDEAPSGHDVGHAEPLTSTIIKKLPLGEIIAATREGQAQQWDTGRSLLRWRRRVAAVRDKEVRELERDYRRRAGAWRQSGRKPRVDYAVIAKTYNDALDAGRPPKQAVIDAHDLPKTTADRAIHQARRMGLIRGLPQAGRRQGR